MQQKFVVLIFSISWATGSPTLQTFHSLNCAYAEWTITLIVVRMRIVIGLHSLDVTNANAILAVIKNATIRINFNLKIVGDNAMMAVQR